MPAIMLQGLPKKISISILSTVFLSAAYIALAQDEFGLYETAQKAGAPTGAPTPIAIIATIIQIILSIIGLVALILILYAGWQWMTAGGNEEKITQAKKIMAGAVVGLALIFSSYIIANFIFKNISQGVSAPAAPIITACATPNSCKAACDNPANDLGAVDCLFDEVAGTQWRCCAEPL